MGKSYPVKIGTKLGVAAGRDYRPDGRVGPGHLTGLAKPEVRRSFHAPPAPPGIRCKIESIFIAPDQGPSIICFRPSSIWNGLAVVPDSESAYGTDQSDQTMSAVRRDARACAGLGGAAPSCTPVRGMRAA